MKYFIQLFLVFNFISTLSQVTTNPSPIEAGQSVTITVDASSTATNCNGFSNPNKVYLHSGIGDDGAPWGFSVVGNWGQDDGIGEMSDNGNGTWSITFVPKTYFGLTANQVANATKMGMVFRNEDGSQEMKDNGCADFIFDVGSFQVSMTTPQNNAVVYKNSGEDLTITAQNTNGNANYELFANGTSIDVQNNIDYYVFAHANITLNYYYELVVTQGSSSVTKNFAVVINPSTNTEKMPAGLENGINYNPSDATKATLVLEAPLKDFIYLAGSFNNWQPTADFAMKKDPNTGKFWYELTDLTSGTVYTYQYWVFETTPITNSPELVKTADPYSTLVLSPFDDPYIPTASYPDLPAYPKGQEREVSVLKTGQIPYDWVVTDFEKPKKEDLVIYEVLIRDFDTNRNFQGLIDRIDYFKNLNINAIELMPVMEFEGNESWGYNPAYHMALDKFYGTSDKFKEFIDLCHQNGIAVILDFVLNHAMGRNPLVRMWMNDSDGDGWGPPSAENPYFNVTPTHSYNVGNDFNHQQEITQNYAKQMIEHWIREYHIDGFRWDLTKGFTQNCTSNDESCTNAYQQDRVDILREYADYSWLIDDTHYVIFEHLGTDSEEQKWANYRVDEGKGIMMWGKMTDPYNELTMGQGGNKNFNRMGHTAHGFTDKRLVGYAESHDEERLMYKNLQYGNTGNSAHNVQELNIALSRMSALGAVTIPIPGPKMIWHFGDLGMDNSIFTCTDGSVDTDCKLATKPQPQWTENWLENPNRNRIYEDWSRLIELKQEEAVFEGSYTISSGGYTPKINIWDDDLPDTQLKNVVILANFNVTTQDIIPDFPYTGTWYDLMDNTSITVNNVTGPVSLNPGEFRIFGNHNVLDVPDKIFQKSNIVVYPNPTSNSFYINYLPDKLGLYDVTGKLVKQFKEKDFSSSHFDISDLHAGLYFVKIEIKNTFVTKRLVVK